VFATQKPARHSGTHLAEPDHPKLHDVRPPRRRLPER
jgi:hypothetical protein